MIPSQVPQLKSVFELIASPAQGIKQFSYWIPSYQRGYRWTPKQVSQLLDDLLEFKGTKSETYCLQPLVVKPRSTEEFEVVDGQQRLTTILLILTYFNSRLNQEDQVFRMDYETRDDFRSFLSDPTAEKARANVDFFHIFSAYETIKGWFAERRNEINAMTDVVLNNAKVIWYELPDGTTAIDAFTRLNVGKIPLQDEELVRAILLKRDGTLEESDSESIRLRIASEWDFLEHELQASDFWYFLTVRKPNDGTRIRLLLELLAMVNGGPFDFADHELFLYYHDWLKQEKGAEESAMQAAERIWNEVKEMYLALREWFEDPVIFHLVGYLVHENGGKSPLAELRKQSKSLGKGEFRNILRTRAFETLFGAGSNMPTTEDAMLKAVDNLISPLEYGNSTDAARIRSVLLLFNVTALLQNPRSNIRFQFDRFKQEDWDLEHIHSVADQPPKKQNDRKEWIADYLELLEGLSTDSRHDSEGDPTEQQGLIAQLRDLRNQGDALDGSTFNDLHAEVTNWSARRLNSEASGSDGLDNLTLLDRYTNRSYKNAPFAIKRHRILSVDRDGIFVPLCTRNVFLKCYSRRIGNPLIWGRDDREGYLDAIIKTLTAFFLKDGFEKQ
jgi:hypothetical protein